MPARGQAQPLRTCVACGRRRPQGELLRLVLAGGLVTPDPDRRLAGRGAYICRQLACAELLPRGRRRGRIFRGTLGEDAWAGFISRPEISALPAQDETA